MVLRKSFYIRWSAGRSPRVHEVNPGRDPSVYILLSLFPRLFINASNFCSMVVLLSSITQLPFSLLLPPEASHGAL